MATLFVAGATGYVGREVVRIGLDAKVKVFAHVRPDSSRLQYFRERFTSLGARVDTTSWDSAAMARTLADIQPDAVFALLGTTRARARRVRRESGVREDYEVVDYGLTVLLVRAVVESAPAAKFVYLSALGVGSSSIGAYYAARERAEKEIRHSGLRHVIVRPSFITGADRDDARPLERMSAAVSDAALGVLGRLGASRLRARYASTTNTQLATALVTLALDPQAEGIFESETLRSLPGLRFFTEK